MDDRSDPQREEVHLGVIDVEEHLHVTARDQLVKKGFLGDRHYREVHFRTDRPRGPRVHADDGQPLALMELRERPVPGTELVQAPDRVGEEYDDLTLETAVLPFRVVTKTVGHAPRKQSGPPEKLSTNGADTTLHGCRTWDHAELPFSELTAWCEGFRWPT